MSDRIMLKQGTHYHATEDGFIEIWPAGLAFAAEVNRAGRDARLRAPPMGKREAGARRSHRHVMRLGRRLVEQGRNA
jgi:hypothetical protein